MLEILRVKSDRLNAKCIIFDGIDVLLDLLNDPVAVRQEIYRLREWLLQTGLTGIITQKVNQDGANGPYSFLQFMVDCVIVLKHQLVEGSAFRNLRIMKYRGAVLEVAARLERQPGTLAEGEQAAVQARRMGLAAIIRAIGRIHRASSGDRFHALAEFAHMFPKHKAELESWALVENAAQSQGWIDALEAGALVDGRNAMGVIHIIPALYAALGVPDSPSRIEELRQRVIQLLIKDRHYELALDVLGGLVQPQPKLEAQCHEALGNMHGAAEQFRLAGDLKNALKCYRSIPDFAAALSVVRQMGDHPAAASLEWLDKVQALVAKRPEKFTRMVTEPEKKLLEDVLEQALGVKRRKPAPKPPRKSRVRTRREPA